MKKLNEKELVEVKGGFVGEVVDPYVNFTTWTNMTAILKKLKKNKKNNSFFWNFLVLIFKENNEYFFNRISYFTCFRSLDFL